MKNAGRGPVQPSSNPSEQPSPGWTSGIPRRRQRRTGELPLGKHPHPALSSRSQQLTMADAAAPNEREATPDGGERPVDAVVVPYDAKAAKRQLVGRDPSTDTVSERTRLTQCMPMRSDTKYVMSSSSSSAGRSLASTSSVRPTSPSNASSGLLYPSNFRMCTCRRVRRRRRRVYTPSARANAPSRRRRAGDSDQRRLSPAILARRALVEVHRG